MNCEWIKGVAEISDDCMTIIFHDKFNQKIEPNSLFENLTTLTFGFCFNQKIEPNSLPENLTTLTFGWNFNQKIEINTLPENLTIIKFGRSFNHKIATLSENVTNITFNWQYIRRIDQNYVNMINNIPRYYNVILYVDQYFVYKMIGSIWPIHVIKCKEECLPSKIYNVIDNYDDPS